MALGGILAYRDLYREEVHNYHPSLGLSSLDRSPRISSVTSLPMMTTSTAPEHTSASSSTFSLDMISFTYFYWPLVVLAIFLILTLAILFIYYCRSTIKEYRTRRRDSLLNYHQSRADDRYFRQKSLYQPTAPPRYSFQTPPCPSKSLESLNSQIAGQDLKVKPSPLHSRLELDSKRPLSTFSTSSSNIGSAAQSRSSIRSSEIATKSEPVYESQRASLNLPSDSIDETN